MIRKAALVAAASLAASGCASYAIFGGMSQLFTNPQDAFLFLRSLTIQPPASSQQVSAFLFPLTPASITKITREQFGAGCSQTTQNCTKTYSGSQITSFFTDASVSADVLYEYTVTSSGGSTKSRWVDPIDVQDQQATLTGPGTGTVDILAGAATPSVSGSDWQFQWQDLANKSPGISYGYYIIVGKRDTSNSSGIDPVYSAFLDESSHSVGVKFGQPSDLAGFSGELLSFLSNTAQFAAFSPKVASGSLAPGTYAWTVVTVDTNASTSVQPGNPDAPVIPAETSYGIAKPPLPTDGKHFLVFQVK